MNIPIELESSTEFTDRIAKLFPREDAFIYVDTSFLMWMTKIGTVSRSQFLDWLKLTCPSRVHIPVWAAHEYLRHHVAGTIVNELDRKARELSDIAGRTYEYLRPFLDAPLGSSTIIAGTQQVDAREVLNEVQRLAMTVKRWNKIHEDHAAKVITFINDHVLTKTPVFDYMQEIEALSKGRFNGRLPPGFQDRRKKTQHAATKDEDEDVEVQVGSNRWGDLIFWREVLANAKEVGAKSVIIISNDRKNDWYLGGRITRDVDEDLLMLRSRWKPVPYAHPMLALEASITAGVEDIVLIDAPYLGVLLRNLEGERAKEFIDVAIVPDPPQASAETIRRKGLAEERLKEEKQKEVEAVAAAGFIFPDSPQLVSDLSAFVRAERDSRRHPQVGDTVDVLLNDIDAAIAAGSSISDLLTQDQLQVLNNSMLTTLVRELHDRSLEQEPGYDEALTDLATMLSVLPELTAASIYLGFIVSMYLERTSTQARLPPRSPIARLLFDRQGAPYAAKPIEVLKRKFEWLERLPLYLLNSDRPTITVSIDFLHGAPGEVILDSVRLAGQEVFTPSQYIPELVLSNIFGGRLELLGSEIVQSACTLFGVPFDQVTRTDNFDRRYKIESTAGFRSLDSVYIDNDDSEDSDS